VRRIWFVAFIWIAVRIGSVANAALIEFDLLPYAESLTHVGITTVLTQVNRQTFSATNGLGLFPLKSATTQSLDSVSAGAHSGGVVAAHASANSFQLKFNASISAIQNVNDTGQAPAESFIWARFTACSGFFPDAPLSYVVRLPHLLSLSNATFAFQLIKRFDGDPTGTGLTIRVEAANNGLVYTTNGNLGLSGVLPPAPEWPDEYLLVVELESRIESRTNIAAFGEVAGFEFRATTLPLPATPPRVSANWQLNSVALTWPAEAIEFDLEHSSQIGTNADWRSVNQLPTLIGQQFTLGLPTSNQSAFFRLKK